MDDAQAQVVRRRLEMVLITFFVLTVLSAVVISAVDPAVYSQILSLQPEASSAYPLYTTLFLVALLVLLSVLSVGVLRHWRWLFWLILLAFGAGLVDIPVTLLQLAGDLPTPFPVWYNLFRMGIACVQVVIAVWMGRIAYQHGAWALGRKKRTGKLQADGLDGS